MRIRPLVVLLVAGVGLLALPGRADAQWQAVLDKLVLTINNVVDTWEKHARIIEDRTNLAGGLIANFSVLNSGFASFGGGRRPYRMADLFYHHAPDPACYRRTAAQVGACNVVRAFVPAPVREVRWRIPFYQGQVQRLRHLGYEDAVRIGWNGLVTALDSPSSQVLRDVYDRWRNGEHLYRRLRENYHRSRWTARRVLATVEAGRTAAHQFVSVDPPAAASAATGRFLVPGGLAAVGNASPCLPGAGDPPPTVLLQALRADCNPNPAANLVYGGPGDDGHHLSETEALTIRVAAAIADTLQLAAQLEMAALAQEEALRHADLAVDLGRRAKSARMERVERGSTAPGPCGALTHAYYNECQAGSLTATDGTTLANVDPDALFRAQLALGG